MKLLTRILLLTLLATTLGANDYIPGAKQTAPILLKGGTLYTVSDGVLENTDLLFDNGRITQIGTGIEAPDGAEVIDVSGKSIYPGLIAAGTSIGLIEVGAVRATKDQSEVGRINPDVCAHTAYNPDSEIIPTVRANGIAYAQIVPGGGLMRGQSCLLSMDAWTKEDAALSLSVGMHLSWPAVAISTGWRESRTPEKQREDMVKNRKRLFEVFDDAQAYRTARAADPDLKVDSRWEAMLPILAAEKPLFVHAGDYRQIEQAIAFANDRALKLIIVGGSEAWKITDLLAANNVPVIYGRSHGLPLRADDDYDMAFKTPRLLHEAGVTFSFGTFSYTGVRNLPFDAGQAVAFGLPRDVALRAMTLTVAEIMGVAEEVGSLEVGKRATITISDGDLMDHLTHNVTRLFIDGRKVDLNNKHKELYEKYRAKRLD
jgi:imidazolonepropionase-like amidohydrolase